MKHSFKLSYGYVITKTESTSSMYENKETPVRIINRNKYLSGIQAKAS